MDRQQNRSCVVVALDQETRVMRLGTIIADINGHTGSTSNQRGMLFSINVTTLV